MTSPIDPSVFAQLEDLEDPDDPGFVDEMVDMFQAETPEILTRIANALTEGDAYGVQAPAHKLKATSGLIGAMTMSGVAGQIEVAAREGQLTGIAPMLTELGTEYLRVCDHLAKTSERSALAA